MGFIRKYIVIPLIALLLTGCGNSKYKINISGQVLNNSLIEIYAYSEKEKVYSMFTEIEYQVDKKYKIPLGEALEKKVITLEEIFEQMEVISALNDGGSVAFEYTAKNNDKKLSNQDFVLVKCNSLEDNGGNKNIYIGNDKKLIKYCNS